jgi:hypothetical protein
MAATIAGYHPYTRGDHLVRHRRTDEGHVSRDAACQGARPASASRDRCGSGRGPHGVRRSDAGACRRWGRTRAQRAVEDVSTGEEGSPTLDGRERLEHPCPADPTTDAPCGAGLSTPASATRARHTAVGGMPDPGAGGGRRGDARGARTSFDAIAEPSGVCPRPRYPPHRSGFTGSLP